MKKILTLSAMLMTACITSFAQIIVNPRVESSDDYNTIITKVETDAKYTTVSFMYTAGSDNAWAQLNKEIYIQTNQGNAHYNFVKAENIAMVPAKHTFAKAGETLLFKVSFQKIPPAAKSIDIIERAGRRSDGITFFNFYNVDLTHSYPGEQRVKITDVVLLPPPPANMMSQPSIGTDGMANAMNAMGPMYTTLAKSMLDAQLDYYKQPGKLTELAKLTKEYFDALAKEGFTYDQALKIITSNSLISKSGLSGQ
jgi:hypothetical protein